MSYPWLIPIYTDLVPCWDVVGCTIVVPDSLRLVSACVPHWSAAVDDQDVLGRQSRNCGSCCGDEG